MNKKNIMDHCDNHKSIHQSKNLQKKMRNDKKVGEKIKIIILLPIAFSSATKEKSYVKGKIHTFSYPISHHFYCKTFKNSICKFYRFSQK